MAEDPSKTAQVTSQILKYLLHTAFFDYLRNTHRYFSQLDQIQLKEILSSGEIFRVKEDRIAMMLNFNQPSLCVVIYGEVASGGRKYQAGDFLTSGDSRLQMNFQQKSCLVMLNKLDLEEKIHFYEEHYFKRNYLQKILPLDLMALTAQELSRLVDQTCLGQTDINERVNAQQKLGVFVLYEGSYAMTNADKIRFCEIDFDYFGEESLWTDNYEFQLTAASNECRYLFIPKTSLLSLLKQPTLTLLRDLHLKKLQLRQKMQQKLTNNLEYTRNFLKILGSQRQTNFQEMNANCSKRSSTRQWRLQQHRLGKFKVTNSNCYIDSPHEAKLNPESERSHPNNSNVFQPKLYKDQRAKSEQLFKRRVRTQSAEAEEPPETSRVKNTKTPHAQTETTSAAQLPKSLSVLLNYYKSAERIRLRPTSGIRDFIPSSRQRRISTTMKLNKDHSVRDYLDIKTIENRAFKSWR